MSEIKHTPGPWNLYVDEDGDAIAVSKWVEGRNGGTIGVSIARMPVPDKLSRPEINANASLIAGAPDLLEALKLLYDNICINNLGDLFDTQDIDMARDAIAKASG